MPMTSRTRTRSRAILALALVLLAPAIAIAALAPGDQDELAALERVYQRAADRVAPSVVELRVSRTADEPEPALPPGTPDEMQGSDPAYVRRPEGPCSGVILTTDGWIVTTAYNVAGTISGVEVVLADGRMLPARLAGRDLNLDVALLKVEAAGLPAAPHGDSAEARAGRFVVLVGRGQGRHATVNPGIVSAVGRNRGDSLQTDAAMNFANAGGALVDIDGNLLAIASKVHHRSRTGQNSGVGFAAPLDRILASLPRLQAGETIPRRRGPFLGIRGNPEEPPGQRGAAILEAIAGGAAAGAGLRAGDRITIFNGIEIEDFAHLAEVIGELNAGDEIIITVLRDGWERDFTIHLGERPEDQ